MVAELCLTLWQPRRLQPARLLCPWDFPGKAYSWNGLPFPLQGSSDPGIELVHAAWSGRFFTTEPSEKLKTKRKVYCDRDGVHTEK